MSGGIEAHADARGQLVAVDLDAAGWDPVRCFVVVGPPEGATRGGHEVPCRELLVLVTGSAVVRHEDVTTELTEPGARLELTPGSMVDYDLAPGGSTILVLADEPYAAPAGS